MPPRLQQPAAAAAVVTLGHKLLLNYMILNLLVCLQNYKHQLQTQVCYHVICHWITWPCMLPIFESRRILAGFLWSYISQKLIFVLHKCSTK